MSNIIAARDELLALAVHSPDGAEIRRIVQEHMWRRPPARRAPARRKKISKDLKREIEQFLFDHPDADLQRVAERFNVNAGRVSEILHGLR